ncbi:hypothetical protein ACIBSW_11970 [Actinoplanes sp. NPDC049668]|uniref:hypothetical protein n=1 Tax=unclassified Actinoplanes TaxID=2626549 RepID=UPI0033B3DC2D
MGKHNARGGGLVPLVQVVVVLALLGAAYAAHVWVAPRILRLVCQATDCAPRAVAVAGWATIAAVPAAIGLVVLADRYTDGWRHWLTIAMAALLAAPGVWLIPGRRDSGYAWDAFADAPGLDTYRAGVHLARTVLVVAGLLYGICSLLALFAESTHPARHRCYVLAGRTVIGLAGAGSLAALLVWPPA